MVATKAEHDTEIWGRYFTENPAFVSKLLPAPARWARPDWRMTTWTIPRTRRFSSASSEALGQGGKVFSADEVVQLLDSKPEIARDQRGCPEGHEADLKKVARGPIKYGVRARTRISDGR